MTREQLSYIAGFFDGEGCIMALQEKNRRTRMSRISVAVSNTDFRPIKMLYEQFGGHYRQTKRENRKEFATWSMSCKKAADFLALILPYLIIKRERAIAAIELYELNNRRVRGTRRNALGQFTKTPPETVAAIDERIGFIKSKNAYGVC